MSEWQTYLPSNGTEGMDFIDQWCCHCRYDTKHGGCDRIIGRSMLYKKDDPKYPKQMQCRLNKNFIETRCTAFRDKATRKKPKYNRVNSRQLQLAAAHSPALVRQGVVPVEAWRVK